MRSVIKKIIKNIDYFLWLFRCKYALTMQGFVGLSRLISLLPKVHIIPILKHYGATIGKNSDIDIGILLHRIKIPLKNLIIGENVHIGHYTLFDLTEEIKIDDNSAIGSFCMFITHAGDWTYDRSDEHEKRGAVIIGKSVIIYSGCIISPNVKISDYARIGANSTVLSDIPPFEFHAGSPAVFKKDRRALFNDDKS